MKKKRKKKKKNNAALSKQYLAVIVFKMSHSNHIESVSAKWYAESFHKIPTGNSHREVRR